MMARKGFYFDQTACIGCRTCQVACKDKNNLDLGIVFRKVRNFETGAYPTPGSFNYSGTCNHCENPKCVAGCPTGAMYIDADGSVQHHDDVCIGCQYCMWNCPYGVPQYIDALSIVKKCNMCKDLTDQGSNPICIDACVMRCLEWGDFEELQAKHGAEAVMDLPILPDSNLCKPSLLIKPKTAALSHQYTEKEV